MIPDPKTFKPPRQRRSRESLDLYLEAAESLIREEGFNSVSVAEVARRAGFSVGGFYSRFPNKMALLAAVRERFLERVEASWQAEFEEGKGADEALDATVRRVVALIAGQFLAERAIFRAFIVESPTNPGFEERGVESLAKRRELVREALLTHREEIRHPDPEAAVDWVFTVVIALMRERLIYGERAPIAGGHSDEELVARLSEMMVVYLLHSDGVAAGD